MKPALNRLFARRSWLQFVTLVGLSGGLAACGSSNNDDGSQVGQAGAAATAKVLTDHAAGKACTSDKDCGTGSCKKELPVALPPLMTSLSDGEPSPPKKVFIAIVPPVPA